ncbi:MAG: hypothetical protein ACWA5A_19355 [Marinibacterium sp.]
MAELKLVVDNSPEDLQICRREMQSTVNDKGQIFVRFVCARCGLTGPAAFGPKNTADEVRDHAEGVFMASNSGSCGAHDF